MPQITIQGYAFDVPPDPSIVAGAQLDDNMAHTLQQTRLENIRNNMASRIKRLMNGSDKLSDEQVRAAEEEVRKYANEYKFGARSTTGPRTTRDPLEKEMIKLAREDLAAAYFAKHGDKLRGEALNENAQKLLDARHDEYVTRARRNLQDREAVGAEVLQAAGI
jgi:hypothetical protein